MWRRFLQGVFLATVALRIIRFIILLGLHKSVYKHHPGPCYRIPGIVNGSEDIQRIDDRRVIISSGLQFVGKHPGRFPNVFLYDVTDPTSEAVALSLKGDLDWLTFNPHGLYVWKDSEEDETYVYIVSHRPTVSVVEKFLFDDKAKDLHHLATFDDKNFRMLNDLVLVDTDKFYFTNFLFYRPGGIVPEDAFQMRWGTVGYHDDKGARVVLSGLYRPNGIAMSPDKQILYLAHGGDQTLQVYTRLSDIRLKLIQDYPLYTNLDNLDVDDVTGAVWTGCHPIRHKISKVIRDPDGNHESPSQVLRLGADRDNGTIWSVEEVMMDDGALISGSSVAVVTGGRLVVGSVTGYAVVCQMPESQV